MQKKLTITIDEEVYEDLQTVVGRHSISRFIEEILKSHVLEMDLDEGYRQMAQDEKREQEALEWAEATIADVSDEPR